MKPHKDTCPVCGVPYTRYIAGGLYCCMKCYNKKMRRNEQRRSFERIYTKHGLKVTT